MPGSAGNQSSVPLVDFPRPRTHALARWESVVSPPGRLRDLIRPVRGPLGISRQSPW